MSAMMRAHVKITGKVQGVFFRAHAQRKAQELDLKGWVANEADGSVAVVLEGQENLVGDFIDWCHSGPSTAHVEKVDVEKHTYTGEFDGFDIRY